MDDISVIEENEDDQASSDDDYGAYITNEQFKKDSERKKLFDLGRSLRPHCSLAWLVCCPCLASPHLNCTQLPSVIPQSLCL